MVEGLQRFENRSTLKWMCSSRQLVKDDPQGKHVAGRRGRFASRLLWRHVSQCSGRQDRTRSDGCYLSSQPKIQNLDEPIRPHHDVLRLDVAMDDTSRMCCREGSSHLLAEI